MTRWRRSQRPNNRSFLQQNVSCPGAHLEKMKMRRLFPLWAGPIVSHTIPSRHPRTS
jgi:hypothetical protein